MTARGRNAMDVTREGCSDIVRPVFGAQAFGTSILEDWFEHTFDFRVFSNRLQFTTSPLCECKHHVSDIGAFRLNGPTQSIRTQDDGVGLNSSSPSSNAQTCDQRKRD